MQNKKGEYLWLSSQNRRVSDIGFLSYYDPKLLVGRERSTKLRLLFNQDELEAFI